MDSDWKRMLTELHIRLFASKLMHMESHWNGMRISSSFWRLYINNRSGAGVEVDGFYYPLKSGRVHIVPAWVSFLAVNKSNPDHYYIHFDVIGFSVALVREVFPRPLLLPRKSLLQDAAKRWMDETSSADERDLASVCRAKALVYLALTEVFAQLSEEDLARCSRHLSGRHAVAPVLDHIDKCYSDSLTNERLAAMCHSSVDHFIRLFKQWTGQTPAQYILDTRVKAAAHELLFTDGSIDSIAEETGFRDRFYFSRVFKRRMGLAPAEYRNSVGK